MQIDVNDAEFLLKELELSEELVSSLRAAIQQKKPLEDSQADQLRDLCGEKLQTHGFDQNYEPNALGRRLEELIDKLFIG